MKNVYQNAPPNNYLSRVFGTLQKLCISQKT